MQSGADSESLAAAKWTAWRPVERRPANAGQTHIFARHRNVLRAQLIPSKCERHAGQSLYVPLAVQLPSNGLGLPPNWKHSGNFLETSRHALQKWKLSVNILENFRALTALADKWRTHPRICLPV